MPALSECELEAMQAETQTFYDHKLDIYRDSPASTIDDYGGYGGGTPTKVHSDIPCEIYPGIAHVVDMLDQGQLVDTQLYTITVALGTDVQKNDEVVITTYNNLRLQVNVVFTPESQAIEMRFVADAEVLHG